MDDNPRLIVVAIGLGVIAILVEMGSAIGCLGLVQIAAGDGGPYSVRSSNGGSSPVP
jgi:hypothetical protein